MSEIQQNIWFHVTSTNASKSCIGHLMTEMKRLNLAIFEAYKYLRPPLGNFKERLIRVRSSPLPLFYHTVQYVAQYPDTSV